MKNRLIRTLCGIVIALLFSAQAGHWLAIPVIERIDGLIYDLRLRLTAPGGVDPRIVILDIVENTWNNLLNIIFFFKIVNLCSGNLFWI